MSRENITASSESLISFVTAVLGLFCHLINYKLIN